VFAPVSLLPALVAVDAPCNQGRGKAPRIYLEAGRMAARDSVMRAFLCLRAGRDARVNSLSARITIDTAFGRIIDVERPAASTLFARVDSAGATVLLAGASSDGVTSGRLLTLRARLSRAGVTPAISVVVTEMNDPSGASLATRAAVAGLDARCVGDQPAVFQVLPPSASADPGEVLDLRITGCGFSASRNVVRFGDVTLRDVRSTERGTRIRVVVPKEVHSGGEVPPMSLGRGDYDVTVNNGRGTSNAKRVTLR